MNWVPVEPVPITPTRLPVMSRSSGQALVCTSAPAKVSPPGMSGMLLFASSPSAVHQVAGGVTASPVLVRTVQMPASSSNSRLVTSVFSWMSRRRSKRSTTWLR